MTDNSEPHPYCIFHDQPLDWCPAPAECEEAMAAAQVLMDEWAEQMRRQPPVRPLPRRRKP